MLNYTPPSERIIYLETLIRNLWPKRHNGVMTRIAVRLLIRRLRVVKEIYNKDASYTS